MNEQVNRIIEPRKDKAEILGMENTYVRSNIYRWNSWHVDDKGNT